MAYSEGKTFIFKSVTGRTENSTKSLSDISVGRQANAKSETSFWLSLG